MPGPPPECPTPGRPPVPREQVGPVVGPVVGAALDLLWGGRCVGCRAPGRALCGACADRLPTTAHAHPAPLTEAGWSLPPVLATGDYAGLLRALVVGHKERGLTSLRGPLSRLLALAVVEAAAGVAGPGELARASLLLVPVPSRPASVRARGADPTAGLTAGAARCLASAGLDVDAVPLLRLRPGVADQAGLDREQRARNLAGSMTVRSRRLRRRAESLAGRHVVLCDDVVTSGATAAEAVRALAVVGLPVSGVACVAATRLRSPSAAHGPASPAPDP